MNFGPSGKVIVWNVGKLLPSIVIEPVKYDDFEVSLSESATGRAQIAAWVASQGMLPPQATWAFISTAAVCGARSKASTASKAIEPVGVPSLETGAPPLGTA